MAKRVRPTTLQNAMQASADNSAEREREDESVVTVFGRSNGTFQVKVQTGEISSPKVSETDCKTFEDVLAVLTEDDKTSHDWLPWPL